MSDFRKTFWVFATTLVFYLLTLRGFTTGEGMEHFSLARHVVSTGSLGTSSELWANQALGPSGLWYNVHDFGNSLLMLPFAAALELAVRVRPAFSAFDHLITSTFAATVMAGIVAAFFFLLRGLRVEARVAAGVAFLLAIGTQLWPYTRNCDDGLTFTFFLTTGAAALAAFMNRPSRASLLVAGGSLGWMIITRPPGLLWLPSFCLPILLSSRTRKEKLEDLLVFSAAMVPFAAWEFFYNHLRTGNPLFPPIAAHDHFPGQKTSYFRSVPALLFSPGCGIFFYNPALLLGFAGVGNLIRKNRVAFGSALLGTVLHFLVYAGTPSWQSEADWGPRYMLMILPLLAVPIAFVSVENWKRYRKLFFAYIGLSVSIQTVAVVVDQTNLIYFHMKHPSIAYVWNVEESELGLAVAELPHLGSRWLGLEPPRDWPFIKGPRQLSANYGSLWFVFAGAFGVSVKTRIAAIAALFALLWVSIRKLRRSLIPAI